MANEPAIAANNLPRLDDSAMGLGNQGSSNMLDGFYGLNILRQLGLMIGLAASVAIGVAIVLWAQGGDYRPLYGNIQNIDASKVIEVLDGNDIRYKIDHKSGSLLVAADKIHMARLKLADVGMPGDRTAGFELLDKEQPLGTSQFMETTRYRRGLEGELARTIKSINVVRNARVHLAIPKATSFIRDRRKPSASVFVELYPGAMLKNEQVKAISNLVASSISELSLEDVTVVDQKGNLLSEDEEGLQFSLVDKQLQYVHKIEDDLVDRIHNLMLPILGEGRFKAQVSADVDFTQTERADEIFNPDLPAVRSEQMLEEQRTASADVAGVPGALSNQPPGAGQAPEQAGAGQEVASGGQAGKFRKQSTRNYELDRTVSYTRHQIGAIRRLTVAVVVDDMSASAAEEGVSAESKPWAEAELARLTILIKDAVGFNAARGDSINVINTSFVPVEKEIVEVVEPQIWEHPAIAKYGKWGVVLIGMILFIFGVMRPVLKNLSSTGSEMRDLGAQSVMGAAMGEGGSDENVTLDGGENMLLPSPSESYEQQINAIKGLIAEDPGRVAQVVKRWVASGD